jgi:hypothetical protein
MQQETAPQPSKMFSLLASTASKVSVPESTSATVSGDPSRHKCGHRGVGNRRSIP